MAPTLVHLIRHAQGQHQLEPTIESTQIHDPSLTNLGLSSCDQFARDFPRHADVDLLCASPMRRTVQTAHLCFPHHSQHPKTRPILLLPDAQEDLDDPCDTGSSPAHLKREFGRLIDLQYVHEGWNDKRDENGTSVCALTERATRLRQWIHGRSEREIVIVSHGGFLHYVTGDVTSHGEQTGDSRSNAAIFQLTDSGLQEEFGKTWNGGRMNSLQATSGLVLG